jgi:hypothetical protein
MRPKAKSRALLKILTYEIDWMRDRPIESGKPMGRAMFCFVWTGGRDKFGFGQIEFKLPVKCLCQECPGSN